MPSVMPESIGRYTILDRIGAGELGDLHRARDTRFGRTVALRVVAPWIAADDALRTRLYECARTALALSHPNIAALFDHGEDGESIYLASEFVPGRSLSHELGGVPFNPRRAASIGAQVADALAEAHAASIVYGHLTTASIIVSTKGTAKLLDVGLTGWREAVTGDERADIAALGRLLAEMATGRPIVADIVPPLPSPIESNRRPGAGGAGERRVAGRCRARR